MPTSATVLTEVDVGCATMCCVLLGPQEKKKEEITDHANPEENGPQRSKERGRRGSTGQPQPEQRRQKHHRDPLVGWQ